MPRRKNENSAYHRTLLRAEKSMIEFAVQQAGSLRAAAPLLGVSVSFLITRAKKLGVGGKKDEGLTKDQWKARAKSAEAKNRESKKKKKKQTTEKPSEDDNEPNNVVPLTRPEAPPENDEDETNAEEAPQPEGA